MSQPNTITLSDTIFEQVQRLATLRQEEVSQVVEGLLRQALPDLFFRANGSKSVTTNGHESVAAVHNLNNDINSDVVIDLTEPDPSVEREVEAYHALHPSLLQKYRGCYVAIMNGRLIDSDLDRASLRLRLNQRNLSQFVLVRKVEQEPERVLYFRSPHFVQDNFSEANEVVK